MDVSIPSKFLKRFFTKQQFIVVSFLFGLVFVSEGAYSNTYIVEDVYPVSCERPDECGQFVYSNRRGPGASAFPLTPGMTITGWAGDEIIGQLDAMIPLYGTPTNFLYIDPQASMHNSTDYSGALGMGYRWLTDSAGILGTYVFADYNHSPNGNGFWFVSPGIERLGDSVDFSANLYVPVSTQSENIGTVQGTQIGENQFVSFQGHNQYDALFETTESVGMGGDVEIGYRIPMSYNPKIFVGGYYFAPQDAAENILGGTLRLEVPLTNNIRVSLSDAYDNTFNNTFKVGLDVDLGGRHTSKNYTSSKKSRAYTYNEARNEKARLATRMLDPIRRNLILAVGPSVTNQPISQNAAMIDESTLVRSHISFFETVGSDPGSTQDGTFENPYQGLTQAHVDDGNTKENTNFYFNMGTYAQNSIINFTNDNIYGRETFNGLKFALPAVGDNRPLFDFTALGDPIAFNMTANTDLVIDAVRMLGNDAGVAMFMTANGTDPIDLTFSNLDIRSFGDGIVIDNLGNIDNFLLTDTVLTDNTGIGFGFDNQATVNTLTVQNTAANTNGAGGIAIKNATGSSIGEVLVTQVDASGNSLGGIVFSNQGTVADLSVQAVQVNNNTKDGIFLDNSGTVTNLSVNTVVGNANGGDGLGVQNKGGTLTNVDVDTTQFDNNGVNGINIQNTNAGTIDSLSIKQTEATTNKVNGLLVTNNTSAGIKTLSVDTSDLSKSVTGSGIFIDNNSAKIDTVNISTVTAQNNALDGVQISNANAGNIGATGNIVVDKLTADKNKTGFVIINTTASAMADVAITNSSFDQNSLGVSVLNTGAGTKMGNLSIGDSSISANTTAGGMTVINGGAGANAGSTMKDVTISDSAINANTGVGLTITNQGAGTKMDNVTVGTGTSISTNTGGGMIVNNNAKATLQTVTLDQATVSGNTGTGLIVNNSDAGTTMKDVVVSDSAIIGNSNNGVLVNNNSSASMDNVTVSGSTTKINSNTGGVGLGVNNSGGTMTGGISVSGAQIDGNAGAGIGINNNGGTIMGAVAVSGAAKVTNNAGDGLGIDNSGAGSSIGSISVTGTGTTISKNAGDGVHIDNSTNGNITGDVTLDSARIDFNDGTGVEIDNSGGGQINNILVKNTIIADQQNGGGLFIDNSSGGTLSGIAITNGSVISNNAKLATGDGIKIDNTGGTINADIVMSDSTANANNGGTNLLVDNSNGTIVGDLKVTNSTLNAGPNDGGSDVALNGISVINGAGGTMNDISIIGSRMLNNLNDGLFIDNQAGSTMGAVLVDNTTITNSGNDGIEIKDDGTIYSAFIFNSTVTGNGTFDLQVSGTGTITSPAADTVFVSGGSVPNRSCTGSFSCP